MHRDSNNFSVTTFLVIHELMCQLLLSTSDPWGEGQSAEGLGCARSAVAAAGRSLEPGGTCLGMGAWEDSCEGSWCQIAFSLWVYSRAAVKPWLSMGFIVQKGRWGPGRSQLGSQAPRNDAGSTLDPLSYEEAIERKGIGFCATEGGTQVS